MSRCQHSVLVGVDNPFRCRSSPNKALALVVCLFAVTSLFGCAINRDFASVAPGVEFTQLKKFYVVKLGPDERGVNRLIKDQLITMGYDATTGAENRPPNDVDAVVTYRDKWWWDITTYMLELTITFRDHNTQRMLATGNSYHTSLSRRSPEEMVREVLTNIFEESRKGKR